MKDISEKIMKLESNKIYAFLLLLIGVIYSSQAQNTRQKDSYKIVRSNLGVSGSTHSIVAKKGTYSISQSIGQSSVIGTYSNKGYSLRQGYQQPLNTMKVSSLSQNNDLSATVYPNPFEQSISIAFSQNMKKNISVLVFDIRGKLIYSKQFIPSQRIQIQLDDLSSGTYLLKILSNSKLFHSKLIKK